MVSRLPGDLEEMHEGRRYGTATSGASVLRKSRREDCMIRLRIYRVAFVSSPKGKFCKMDMTIYAYF
jgi:hypothetical protein